MISLPTATIYYERGERLAGTSKYPLVKMLVLAITGITSFSVVPLRLISILGFMIFFLSATLGLWALFMSLFTDATVPGWTSTVLPIYFIGGVQLLSLCVIGEYIGKIYNEVKARPKFIIDRKTD